MSGTKILIVEDETIIALDIKDMLSARGFDVQGIISTGEEAIKAAQEKNPDIILMDIILKGKMDGITAISEIKSKFDIPFIFMTAHTDENTFKRAKAAEPHGYIIKPINQNELNSSIEIALYKHEIEKKLKESERRYRELFNNMSSGVAVYEAIKNGKDFIFKDFNKTGERLEKISKEEILDRPVTEVFPGIRQLGLLEVFGRVWKTGKAELHPTSLYEDNRLSHWVENYVYKLPSGQIVAVYDDVTAQKRIDLRMQRINSCLLSLDNDYSGNINRLTALCGELLNGDFALYNRRDGDNFTSVGLWNAPEDFQPVNKAEDMICNSIISKARSEVSWFNDLKEKDFIESYPVIKKYDYKTYIGIPIRCEQSYIGSLCVLSKSLINSNDEDMRIIGIIASAIGREEERRVTEKKLLEIQENYALAQEIARVGSFEWDLENDSLYWSDELFKIFGIDMEKHQASNDLFLDILHPEDKPIFEKIMATIREYPPKEIISFRILKDGATCFLSAKILIIKDRDGKIQKVAGVIQDITPKKTAELRLLEEKEFSKTIIDSITDTVFVFDINTGRPIVWNEAFMKKSGYSDEEIAAMKAPDDWFGEEDLHKTKETTGKLLKGGEDILELSLIAKDGRKILTEYRASLIRDTRGSPKYIIATGREKLS